MRKRGTVIGVGRSGRVAAFLTLAACVLLAVACSDPPAAVTPLDVEFVVSLQEGQAWSASGPAVEADLMCDSGHRRWLGAEDLDGNTLTDGEVGMMQREARATRKPPPIVHLDEWICADGRGAFVSRDPANVKTWTITTGKGAFAGLSGTGPVSFVETLEAIPDLLLMDAALTLDQP